MEPRIITKGQPIRKEKIIIDGESRLMDVYRVDIDTIYYNNENGRIATFMAEYNSNHSESIMSLDFEAYNDQIMKFIKKSGSASKFKLTKDDIAKNGQLKTGIILSDGRIIDGNRRFTCLRELYNETKNEKYKFFECFILDVPQSDKDRITIKTLELKYQFGEDQREDYNAIDRLVDVYNCLVGPNKIFTPKEYCERVNNQIKEAKIKQAMTKASIMHDYLDYIGAPERYDIARDKKLDGPIQEIANLRNKIKSDEEWNEVYPVLFNRMKDEGDKTRNMRDLINVYKNNRPMFDTIKDKLQNIEMQKDIAKYTPSASDQTENIENLKMDYKRTLVDAKTETGKGMAMQKPHDLLVQVLKKLKDIDMGIVERLSGDLKEDFRVDLIAVENIISKLKIRIDK